MNKSTNDATGSRVAGALWIVILAGMPGPGQAEGESTTPGESARRLEEVQVTATRRAESVQEVAGGVTVLGSEALEAEAPQVLPDALKGQTGAWVQQTTPGQATVFLRGLKGSEVLHLVDGMRLNNAFFRNAPSQYLALVDGQLIERVEVLRGPASALYGSDAMGGVVQVLSSRPRFEGNSWGSRGHFRGRYSSAHDARLGRFEFSGGHQGLGLGAGFTFQDVGNRRVGGGSTLSPSAWSARAFDLAALAARKPDEELAFSVQYLEQPETPRYDELAPGFGQSEPASEIFNFEPNDRLFIHGNYNIARSVGFADSLDLHIGLQEINDDRRTRDTGSRDERRERNRSRLFGLTLQATSELAGGHELVYGIERYSDAVSSSRISTDMVTGVSGSVSSRFPDGSSMDSLALYLGDRWQVSERLSMNIGARYSDFDTLLPAADRGVGARVRVDDLTGNLGLNFEISRGLNLTINAGRGFRPPNIFDLGTLGPRPGNRFNVANPGLEPESVITGDIGLKYSRGSLGAELFLWNSRYRDKIVSVPTGEISAEGRDIVRSENLNEVRLRGLEAGFWHEAGRFEAYGTFTASWGEERVPGGSASPADRIPPANGRLGLIWRPTERIRVEPFIAFSRSQERLSARDISDPRIDPAGTPGWVTANLRLSWYPSERWQMDFNLLNLLDAAYREHGSGIDAPGRDAVLAIEARFGD